jgi:hypothetical protein
MTKNLKPSPSDVSVRPRAVVLCAGMNGLGAVRSLGIAGVPTIAVTLSSEEPILRSRFGDKLEVASEMNREEALVEELLRIGKRHDVLIATSDYITSFIRKKGRVPTSERSWNF